MKAPSEKKLMEEFRLDKSQAKLIRAFAKAEDDPEKLEDLVEKVPGTESYVRSMYSIPYNTAAGRTTVVLHAMSEILEGHGVEALGPSDDWGAPDFEYINMGDSYAATLIYEPAKDRVFISTWADVMEAREENPPRKRKTTRRKVQKNSSKRVNNVRRLVAKALK